MPSYQSWLPPATWIQFREGIITVHVWGLGHSKYARPWQPWGPRTQEFYRGWEDLMVLSLSEHRPEFCMTDFSTCRRWLLNLELALEAVCCTNVYFLRNSCQKQ